MMTIGPAAPELTAHLLDDRLTLARRSGARYTQPMVLVEGRKQRRVDRWWLLDRAGPFRAVHVDFGTGDGTFVRRVAQLHPAELFIGVDAIADNLRDASRRAPSNAMFGLLSLEDAPGDLAALADRLTVLFPWGSLLDAVALPEPASLARLRALCKPGAEVRIVFERASRMETLESAYGEAGLAMRERQMSVEEVRALPTTWAKKLGYSGRPRQFCAFEGRVVP